MVCSRTSTCFCRLSFFMWFVPGQLHVVVGHSLCRLFQDKYVLLSLVILCVVCIWHAVVTVFHSHGAHFLAELERDVFIAFALIYIICHLVFMFWLYFDVSITPRAWPRPLVSSRRRTLSHALSSRPPSSRGLGSQRALLDLFLFRYLYFYAKCFMSTIGTF